jgi:hypothetical protein
VTAIAGVVFTASAFPPLALGFFGLGTGYLIYGSKELLGGHMAAGILPVRHRHHLVHRLDLVPVGLLFLGLFAVYFCDFFAAIGLRLGERV